MNRGSPESGRLLRGIMLAVAVWGSLLALGAFLFGYDAATGEVHYSPNPLRGLIVFGCVAAFLGIWALLLVRRRSP